MERSSCFSVQSIYPCTAVTFCLLILPDEGLSFKAETSEEIKNLEIVLESVRIVIIIISQQDAFSRIYT